jgi:hypothetical protein
MSQQQSTPVPVQYTLEQSAVTKIFVTATDGQKYVLKMTPVVFGVSELVGVPGPNGGPGFEVRTNLAIDVTKEG